MFFWLIFLQKSKMQGIKSQISAPVQSLISELNRAYHDILFIFFLHFKMKQKNIIWGPNSLF